jgi:SRSO17 transposase
MSRADAARWARGLDAVMERLGARFGRVEPRRRALAYLRGLLSPIERKNGWQLAEVAGDRTPDGVQDFLSRAHWEADLVRDDLRAYVVEHLGDEQAVLVLDETGFLKKGDKSCGVQRQYSGTAGRIENCQIGVFLGYASRHGQALIDRALYLPQSWAGDPPRRAAAGVPERVGFATKPQLGCALLVHAFAAGVPCAWVTADSIYGADYGLRRFIERHGRGYVLAVTSAQRLALKPVADWLEDVPARAWQRLSAGDGSKGPRLYDWAHLPYRSDAAPGWQKGLLIRRKIRKPEEFTFYLTLSPTETPLTELVRVAGARWTIEACFEAAKGLPPRRWGAKSGWTSTRCAHGPLGTAISRWPCWPTPISPHSAAPQPGGKPGPDVAISAALQLHLLPHTVPELRRLLWHLVWARPPDPEHVLAWSRWRRRHQQRARRCHWKRRAPRNEIRL